MDVAAGLFLLTVVVGGFVVVFEKKSLLIAASSSSSADNTLSSYIRQLLTYFRSDQRDAVVHLQLHAPTELHCPAMISPDDKETSILWYRDGSLIKNATGRWISPDGTLYLEALEKPEALEGTYECHVRHWIGVIAGQRLHLRAPKLPGFTQHPQDTAAVHGESARFECVANGTPKPVIVWLKDGQPLNVSLSRIYTFYGVLQITELTRENEGAYECRATNVVGEGRSRAAKLTITNSSANERVAPTLLSGPLDQSAVVFDRVLLECLVAGQPQPVVNWMKRDGATYQLSGQIRVTRLGNLEFRSVQLSDSGVYICSWNGADGPASESSAQASLSVHAPPSILPDGGMEWLTLLHRRQVLRLACNFGGVPLPKIVWLRNGKVVEPNGRIRIEDSELIISSSDTGDYGFYQCRGENHVGAAQSVTWVNIEINGNAPFPPVGLVAIPLSSTSVHLTWRDHPLSWNRTIIAYSIHSFRTEDYSFLYRHEKKENQVVVKKFEDLNPKLNIDGLDPFTNYTFYVVAYNVEGGSDYSSFVTAVTNQDVPRDSLLIEVVAFGANELKVRWSELSEGVARGIVLRYKVLCRLHGDATYQQYVVDAENQEFVIQGLLPETEYDVAVVAATEKGFSPLDSVSWVTVTTEASGKIGDPDCLAMNISLLNSCKLLVTWQSRNASRITGFRLTNQKAGPDQTTDDSHFVKFIIDLDSGADKYIFTQLDVPAVYQVNLALQSESDDGCSVTKTFRIESLPNGDPDVSTGNLPVPPTKIFAKAVNGSAIMVQWERPLETEPITRYTIRCHPDSSEAMNIRTDVSVVKLITSPKEMIVIGGLIAYTTYDLSIQTHTSHAIGPFSSTPVKCLTAEGVPSEPLNVRLTLYSSTTVQVSWNPPSWKNGVIQNYHIYYSADSSMPLSTWLNKTSGGSSLSNLVAHLAPNAFYYFSLRAATFVGVGLPSEVVRIQTQQSLGVQALDVTSEPSTSTLSDLDLGIIIGTAIGVACIILCVIVIVVRDRHCDPPAVPSARNHVANGAVKSCRCHLSNCSGAELPREPWPGADTGDDIEFPSANSVLVENENCDTKGGYTQGGRNVKIPLHVSANNSRATPQRHRPHPSEKQNNLPSVPTSVEDRPVDDTQDRVPDGVAGAVTSPDQHTRSPISMQPPSHVAPELSQRVTDSEPINSCHSVRPGSQANETRDSKIDLNDPSDDHYVPTNRELEQTESLLGNSCQANCDLHFSGLNTRAGNKSANVDEENLKERSKEDDDVGIRVT